MELFRNIYQACFKDDLKPEYSSLIDEFATLWESLKLPNSSKFHILRFHVRQFCEDTGRSLGVYGEQASESVHSDFAETWARYQLPKTSKSYFEHLLRSVVDYNSGHVNN